MSSLAPPRESWRRGRVLPEHARVHNRVLVQRSLFHGGPKSRADLARETGLTRVTVSGLVAELIDQGLVVEKGMRAPSGPGKPGLLVDLDREGLHVLSLDLSGVTAYRGALMDLTGAVLFREEEPRREEETSGEALDAVLKLARSLMEQAQGRLLGAGVGSPGVISEQGVVLAAPNIGWDGVPLRDRLAQEVGLPVVVRNDANAAALAEHTLGNADPDLLLIRVGRGVGAALLINGELVVGRHNAGGEIGHVSTGGQEGPICACGKRGCLEAWISVPRLTAMLEDSEDRAQVLHRAGERLGDMLAPIVGALNLSDVIVAGPEELLGGTFLEAALENLRSHTLGRFHTSVRMRLPGTGGSSESSLEGGAAQSEDIVLRGGLVMVLSSELGIS